MANYLITGAAGFIGSHLARKLADEGNTITVIDNLSTGNKSNIVWEGTFIEGDDFNPKVIEKLNSQKFDAIFHIAGQSSGEISFENPIYDLNCNAASTLLLLDYAKRTGCKRFVYASSMSVYGDENKGSVNEATAELKPKSFYAVGKIASEHYMRIYSQYGIRSTALRFNNTYGSGQNMENLKQGMVSIFLAQAVKNHHIIVKGDKNRFRDFVHVDDTVRAIIMASKGKEPELYNFYNVATNKKTTCEELINVMKKYLPFEVSVEYTGSTPGDQYGIYCDYSKIEKSLGWKPEITLDEGIKEMCEWALKL